MTRKKQIIIPIGILLAGVGLMAGLSNMKKPPEEKPEVDTTPIVAVEDINVTPLTLEVASYGIVQPKYETELVAQVSGQIVELSEAFLRGGQVKKDQLLARIDPSDYEAALIDAQATMASARSALETERAQGKVAEQEWKRITDSSPTELSLRKPQLAQELARVKAAQAAVLRAKRNLERTEIRAPYDAMIDSRNIGLGSFVGVGTQVGKVLGTDTAEVRLPVADNQLQFLAGQGVHAKVILNGVFAGQERQWPATIARSEGVVDNKSRMSYLVAEINDPYALTGNSEPLRFGAYVNASIQGIEIAHAAIVPRYLVNEGRVAILDNESLLRYVDLEIARQDGANVVVSNGLKQGDRLIVSALDFPVDGMKLALGDEEGETESDNDQQAVESDADTQIASVED
ncbi:efflux RND transporter periplasmic adaptor subunit [Thalassomonas actiniarum]|uniref:Efflux RND transporter periplasmic adaptor subunit n=1 Tax=Thalassomonas actiniarum TaxID=485447 RepID=A0AAE9YR41_9GAMM|nr:efflux RND transporter periplasmic adaptor subunit [Thalassomonas actiniarum]WDD99540.1 efflux RND transporter periplasmic adaptor subunit [Thalassomonas actiniarum]